MNTEFLLFTPQNSNSENELSYKNPDTIRNSKFDVNLPLKLIIHGFTNQSKINEINYELNEVKYYSKNVMFIN